MDTITIRGNAEIIATMPYTLGFHPSRSIVILGLRDGRAVVTERNDLPPPGDETSIDALLAGLAPVLRAFRAAEVNQACVLAYEGDAGTAGRMVGCVASLLEHAGIALLETLLIRGDRWWSVDAYAVSPPAGDLGQPLPDPAAVPAVAELVGRGRAPAADREALRALVSAGGGRRAEHVARLLRARLARGPEGPSRAPTPAQVRALQSLLAREAGGDPDPADIATVAWTMLDPGWRDGVIAWLCPGSLPLEMLAIRVGNGLRRLQRVGDAGLADLDSPTRLATSWLRWCRLLPDDAGAATAGMLAVGAHLAWWAGDGALARVALDRALRVDPDHTLARLIVRLLDLGVRPGHPARPRG